MNSSNKLLSSVTAFRTYAKYLSHLGRRETLEETINRNMLMHLDRFPHLSKDIVKAYQRVHALQVMPSMRGLQFGGEAVLKNNIRQYNCFTVDTKFVTSNGIISFLDCFDGQEITVLADRGWKPATVKMFGEEEIVELTIVRSGKRKETIKTTSNHRWLTTTRKGSGSISKEVLTKDLIEGDVLKYAHKGNRSPELNGCPIAIQHGIVFGDGTFVKEEGSTQIALCGDSVELERFFNSKKVRRGIKGGVVDEKIIFQNLPYNFKELPSINANKEYLLGFLQGWFAADGSIGQNGSNVALYSANRENLDWAKSALSILNIFCSEVELKRETSPFDGSYKPLYVLNLNTQDLFKDFFLKTKHNERFKEELENRNWVVESIFFTGKKETVWCVQQPETETFTLANGVVTKNCSFIHMSDVRAFGEILFLLLSGTGVGYSVQRIHTEQLPSVQVPKEEGEFLIHDSIEGWAQALDTLMESYFFRRIRPKFNFSNIREKGSYLVTTGARAPGPEPLRRMLEQVEQHLKAASGRKLKDIEIHDLNCIIADCVLAGGIRRAAMISLFDRNSDAMLKSKHGSWWEKHAYRARANNSAVLPRAEVTQEEFYHVYKMCIDSNSGEPGFFWTNDVNIGTNPCSEISLNTNQFCNLTTINQTGVKDKRDFLNRVYAATLIGTMQAAYTDFPYIRPIWKETTEREALLGVSFTGIADASNQITQEWLQEAATLVLDINQKYAKKLGINIAARTTAIKPEGTASCVLGSSSGIHARHSDYYLRRIRMNKDDALSRYLKSVIPDLVEDDVFSPTGVVVTIPQESPKGSILRQSETALSLLDRTLSYHKNWIQPGHRTGANTHNVSVTISYKQEEVEELRHRLWESRDNYTGISLLPFDGGTYQQAPFEDCSKETYEKYSKLVSEIDLKQVKEMEDNTSRVENLACSSGVCELTF